MVNQTELKICPEQSSTRSLETVGLSPSPSVCCSVGPVPAGQAPLLPGRPARLNKARLNLAAALRAGSAGWPPRPGGAQLRRLRGQRPLLGWGIPGAVAVFEGSVPAFPPQPRGSFGALRAPPGGAAGRGRGRGGRGQRRQRSHQDGDNRSSSCSSPTSAVQQRLAGDALSAAATVSCGPGAGAPSLCSPAF